MSDMLTHTHIHTQTNAPPALEARPKLQLGVSTGVMYVVLLTVGH